MIHNFNNFLLSESIKFKSMKTNKDAKTEVFEVTKDGEPIGLVKWSSRVRGYDFQPTKDCESEIKSFIKELMVKYRLDKKKK